MRIDLSTLHKLGSIRALYSLNYNTGLMCLEFKGLDKKGYKINFIKKSSFIIISYIQYVKNHKNSKGESAPWVIKEHNTGRILSSHKTREEAEKHLKQIYYFRHKKGNTEANEWINYSDKSLSKNPVTAAKVYPIQGYTLAFAAASEIGKDKINESIVASYMDKAGGDLSQAFELWYKENNIDEEIIPFIIKNSDRIKELKEFEDITIKKFENKIIDDLKKMFKIYGKSRENL
jgi:hypothetical protein